MKTSAILLAGAVAFDLGTMVVPGYAATDYYLKIDHAKNQPAPQDMHFIKIDRTNTASACTGKGGSVVQHDGFPQCQLPNGHR